VRKVPVLLTALAVAGGVAATLPAAAAAAGTASIPSSHPDWANPHARVATTAASTSVSFDVYLQPQNEAGAEAQAQAVSDPNSASYRHYLSPAQVKAQYAPSASMVESVRGWLTSNGFKTGAVPSNNAYVQATGTVAQIDQAFHVNVGQYTVNGQQLRSTDTALTLPANIAGSVLGVSGISQSTRHAVPSHTTGNAATDAARKSAARTAATPGQVAPPAGFRNSQPCGAYFGQKVDTTDPKFDGQTLNYAPCGYTPAQLRSADGIATAVDHGIDGRGTTVAIVDAYGSKDLQADATKYAKTQDPQHPLKASQYREQVAAPTPGTEDPTVCDAEGWYGEQTLDVEAVHGMAPGANILYVGAADCNDTSLDDALNSVVAAHSADIITNSYGDQGEDGIDDVQEFNTIAVQAALEGIGVYFSSGDDGDEAQNLGHPEADFSASDPWVTAVGGTSLGIGKNGQKTVETGWSTGESTLTSGKWVDNGYVYGAGGGTSVLFPEPFYQKGVVPNALAAENHTGGATGRVVPDVSDLADPNTGFLVGETQTFTDGTYYDVYRIGGTSLASPLFAGTMAVSDSLDHFHHGFVNPVLYATSSRTHALSDVTPTNVAGDVRVDYVNGENASGGLKTTVRTFNDDSRSIHTTKGYDNMTGLGTPNGLLFLALS
jgi:subtilase family serine protease